MFRQPPPDAPVLVRSLLYGRGDLTYSAMTALKPNAEKLNARPAELFGRADNAIVGANAYFRSLKAANTGE
jgi:hypothetical protein